MTDYFRIQLDRSSFLESLKSLIREAETEYPKEKNSVNLIQKVYRGYCVRYDIYLKSLAANEIQRVYRGHVGRYKAHERENVKVLKRENALYTYFALQLQRTFRAFHSRKFKFDFAKRKREVQYIIQKGEEIRETMEKYAQDQKRRCQEEELQKKSIDMTAYAQNLHHLLSTKHIRGVYNPDDDLVEAPTLHDTPVENHIRCVVRDLLKMKGISKRGMVRDINGTKRVPLKGLKNRLSIQASSHYDAIRNEKARDNEIERLITREKGVFQAGGKTNIIHRIESPMSIGSPYVDTWSNPMTIRGVPQNQDQLKESCRTGKPLFSKSYGIPFISRTGGNKSSVLPNDLFDVIAEAEESGGTAHRHMGMTSRFGLPESVDQRVEDTTVNPIKGFAKSRSMTRVKVVRNPATYNSKYFDGDDSSSDGDLLDIRGITV